MTTASGPEGGKTLLVEVDSRGRVALGKLIGEHRRFLARVEPGGVIVLEPAVVVPASQVPGAAHHG